MSKVVWENVKGKNNHKIVSASGLRVEGWPLVGSHRETLTYTGGKAKGLMFPFSPSPHYNIEIYLEKDEDTAEGFWSSRSAVLPGLVESLWRAWTNTVASFNEWCRPQKHWKSQ